MQNTYEAPELKLIGDVEDVVMGSGLGTGDFLNQSAPDFEFEQD
ncbi:MAG TPA: lasso RiPP family leader peptide-containing protein [Candidatus Acidoferrum sp.]|nr:lasso RiPP family leader peptide-containing protein [Candidatus Acidoferrum sp.]